jgi:hypothetical protein
MNALEFLQTILPEEGFKFVGLSRAGSPGIAHKAYESLEVMADAITSYNKQPNLTVYHACAAYKAPFFEAEVNGEIKRKAKARLVRDGVVVQADLSIDTLRRFKDDASEVREGFECGIGLGSFNDVKVGDIIETFEMREIVRS